MTLHFRPLPPAAEPACIKKVRRALNDAPTHPDVREVDQILDVMAHAILRLREIGESIADASIREAITEAPNGALAVLDDAMSDVAWALHCWREDNPTRSERAEAAERERWG